MSFIEWVARALTHRAVPGAAGRVVNSVGDYVAKIWSKISGNSFWEANYFVGQGGNDANDGTTWATRKATIAGALAIPPAEGQTVAIGPGLWVEDIAWNISGVVP